MSFAERRAEMVGVQLKGKGINDSLVVRAFSKVPREEFVLPADRERAYFDRALPIGRGQTISQPWTAAFMLQSLKLKAGERVLEVGSGSGYLLALISRIVGKKGKVFGVEKVEELAERSRMTLSRLGYANVGVVWGDGRIGFSREAPFDAVVVSAGAEEIPKELILQLTLRGRLIIPVGRGGGDDRDFSLQMMLVLRKRGRIIKKALGGKYVFVRLV